MLLPTLKFIFERDLKCLRSEIEQYQNEENLWLVEKNIKNSAGNLCLHLIGNLRAFVGAELGGFDYVRDRPYEFAGKGVPKVELLQGVDETIEGVLNALEGLKEEDLEKDFPVKVFAEKTSITFMLVHLTTHLRYHIGQINYHRRLLDSVDEVD